MARLILALLIVLLGAGVYWYTNRDTTDFGANISQNTINRIITLQENYKATNGRYLQILEGNKLPHYETGTILNKLGEELPEGVSINIYEGEDGNGYQICYEDIDARTCRGFGPQAATYTFTTPKWQYDPRIATTTP